MIFEVTTDLTLIELLDYDNPLLKEAQRETNGTFNHSIVVGNLAEACAKAIGAHSLLCRLVHIIMILARWQNQNTL